MDIKKLKTTELLDKSYNQYGRRNEEIYRELLERTPFKEIITNNKEYAEDVLDSHDDVSHRGLINLWYKWYGKKRA